MSHLCTVNQYPPLHIRLRDTPSRSLRPHPGCKGSCNPSMCRRANTHRSSCPRKLTRAIRRQSGQALRLYIHLNIYQYIARLYAKEIVQTKRLLQNEQELFVPVKPTANRNKGKTSDASTHPCSRRRCCGQSIQNM